MSKLASWCRGVAGCAAMAAAFAPAPAARAQAVSASHTFLENTCYKCHSESAESASALFSGFYLDRLNVDDIAAAPQSWEKVVRKLRTGMMPPSSEPRPDGAQKQRFLTYLEAQLDQAAARSPNPGRPALHRLNRTEYANAIRDLLALDIDAKGLLPGDDSSAGFDNVAGSLGISAVLI